VTKESSEKAKIEWATVWEKNNMQFVIERSLDGELFNAIGVVVSGSGDAREVSFYSFFDLDLPFGIIYYRLKQVDMDGKIQYTEIKTLNNIQDEIHVFVADDFLYIEGLNIDNFVQFDLYTIDAKMIFSHNQIANQTKIAISLPHLAKGMYLLNVVTNDKVKSVKLIF
jgi:hypothetical protein